MGSYLRRITAHIVILAKDEEIGLSSTQKAKESH